MPLEGVQVIALRDSEVGAPVDPTAEQIATGRYPLDRFIYLYLRAGKGMPLDPFAEEYIRLALSDEGQHAIASAGFLPLNEGERAEERAKLAP